MIMVAGLVSLAACDKEVIHTVEPEEPLTITYIHASEESSEEQKPASAARTPRSPGILTIG
jgi:hypothetical protein